MMKRRLADVQKYRDALEAHLRSSLVGAAEAARARAPSTSCQTTPLSDEAAAAAVAAQAAYYAGPWHEASGDAPGHYAAGCGLAFHTSSDFTLVPQRHVQCYDPVCAPGLVADFTCGALEGAV